MERKSIWSGMAMLCGCVCVCVCMDLMVTSSVNSRVLKVFANSAMQCAYELRLCGVVVVIVFVFYYCEYYFENLRL